MKNEIEQIKMEAQILLNNEIVVDFIQSQFHGQTGIVKAIMKREELGSTGIGPGPH